MMANRNNKRKAKEPHFGSESKGLSRSEWAQALYKKLSSDHSKDVAILKEDLKQMSQNFDDECSSTMTKNLEEIQNLKNISTACFAKSSIGGDDHIDAIMARFSATLERLEAHSRHYSKMIASENVTEKKEACAEKYERFPHELNDLRQRIEMKQRQEQIKFMEQKKKEAGVDDIIESCRKFYKAYDST